MPTQTIRIVNEQGLHMRPAVKLVTEASKYKADVFLSKVSENGSDAFEVNGKSIMGVIMLEAWRGSRLAIRTEGADADAALAALVALVESGFGED
jgi:phosphocarrier protein